MQVFKLDERELQPRCWEIAVIGELDLAVADRLQAALDAAARKYKQILINLERCEFIDSTGIAVIVFSYRELGSAGRRVVAFGPREPILRTLSVTGLIGGDIVFDNLEAALAATGPV